MSLYLYGVIAHGEATDFGPIGFGGGSVRAIPCGHLAAVVGQAPIGGDLTKAPKETLVKLLLTHQQTLETLMKRFFVLPFKFGTTLDDEMELGRLLQNGEQLLGDLLSQMYDAAEIDVVATWEVLKILKEIAEEDPEVIAAKQEEDRVFVGMLLAQALQKKATQWRHRITEILKKYSEGIAEHDLLNDAMVMNSSFLVRRSGEEAFSRGVEEADQAFEGKLSFRCVGPLPPYSFATLTIKRFDPARIEEAARILRLNSRAELTQVKKIYKELSRISHPDSSPDLSTEIFEKLNQAYELVADYCKDGPKSLARESVARNLRIDVAVVPGEVAHGG